MRLRSIAAICLCAAALLPSAAIAQSRVKDISTVQGIRDNQLVGYGLVIGLAGTGDSLRNSPFTEQSLRSMLQKMGVGVDIGSVRSKNTAAVVVTAILPPFVETGTRFDVDVSSLGDATSLAGGTLVMTPLIAADSDVYAVAQGSVAANGLAAKGDAQSLQQGVPTGGRIANGAIVERDNTADINAVEQFTLRLHNPDFGTAARMADAINAFSRQRYGQEIAAEHDDRTVDVKRPAKTPASRMLAEIGGVLVDVDAAARIVIDEKNGTIVMGGRVRVLPVAVSHGNLVVRITEEPLVSQPDPLSQGETVIVPRTDIDVERTGGPIAMLRGPTLENLVAGLNKMGVKPADIVAILQTIKAAGALQAELIVR